MMINSWALKGRLQYILARGLLQEQKMMIMNKKEEPNGDGYIVSPYLTKG